MPLSRPASEALKAEVTGPITDDAAALTRFASLSSILGAWTFCGIELWQLRPAPFGDETWSLALFSTLVPLLIVIRHRSNLVRLMRGTEPKFEFGGKSERAAVPAVGEKQSP